MRGDMIGLVTADLVLRPFRTGVVRVAFIVEILRVDPDDMSADPSSLGVPADVVAYLETVLLRHFRASSRIVLAKLARIGPIPA